MEDERESYAARLEAFRDADCNTRMWVIAREAHMPLSTIRGYAEILRRIDPAHTPGLPVHFSQMVQHIADAERKLSLVMSLIATYESLHPAEPGQGGETTS